ncbi:MAG: DUF3604 domain-containing protein [Chloroflexota bacterium]
MNRLPLPGKKLSIGILFSILLLALVAYRALTRPADAAHSDRPADAAHIQAQMQAILSYLDSAIYEKAVTWDEHYVLVYQVAQGRPPTPLEFFTLRGLRQEVLMSRSGALSVALRGQAFFPTWSQLRDFVNRADQSSFRVNVQVQEIARQLAATPTAELRAAVEALTASTPDQTASQPINLPQPVANGLYNTYYGFLHAHSHLSLDATGDPADAYAMARNDAGMDFFSLSDHGEFLMIWPWENKWQQLVDAAEASYDPGAFVSLWGFEWSNPVLGHLVIANSSDYTNAVWMFSLPGVYNWIYARPEAIATFNHPGSYDLLSLEFHHFRRYNAGVAQVVGMELWNGGSSFDTYYYDGGYDSDYSYYDEANRKGWYIGALGADDNHGATWGLDNDFRTGVLATELTREAILDAYTNRRFFSTEDKDLSLDFRAQGYPMGSRLTGVPADFDLTACDGSGDTFQEARLYRNGDLLQTQTVSGNCLAVTFSDPAPTGRDYYYVIVKQNDDNDGNGRNDEAISSPIWLTN